MAGKGPPNELDYLQQPFSDANSCPDLIKGRGQQEDAESLCRGPGWYVLPILTAPCTY